MPEGSTHFLSAFYILLVSEIILSAAAAYIQADVPKPGSGEPDYPIKRETIDLYGEDKP
ncbi:hypothetical protein [Neobacillus sp. Marseille-QA0830]